jgi:hypothetical protein
MAGLLDGFSDFVKTPEGQGLLAAAFGGLAGARRGQPLNSLGRAGLAGLSGYGNAQDRIKQDGEAAFQKQFRQLQMDDMTRKVEKQKAEQKWREQLPGMMTPKVHGSTEQTRMLADQMGPDADAADVAMTTGGRIPLQGLGYGTDKAAIDRHMMDQNSPFADEWIKQQIMPKQGDAYTLSEGQTRYGPDGKPLAALPKSINYNDMLIPDGNGGWKVNDLLVGAKTQVASAGRPSVTVHNKVENKASESVAGQVGPILEKSLTSAEGAMRVLDASERVIRAMDSGKVITGPLANARVSGLQIGQMLGVGGKDSAEVLANTRQAIRGLSEMTLQGRKEMSGQGAITDRESALAEKATSGDISDLTAAEVKILANASARASRYAIQKHQARVKSAGALPGMGNITPFFDVPAMDQTKPSGGGNVVDFGSLK